MREARYNIEKKIKKILKDVELNKKKLFFLIEKINLSIQLELYKTDHNKFLKNEKFNLI